MNKAEYAAYLLSPHWLSLRTDLYASRGKSCMACGSRRRIEAHHVRYRTPITACTADDLMPLCRACHSFFHHTPELESDCRALETNDERRLRIILEIQAVRPRAISPPRGTQFAQSTKPAITPAGRRFRRNQNPRIRKLRRRRSRRHPYPDSNYRFTEHAADSQRISLVNARSSAFKEKLAQEASTHHRHKSSFPKATRKNRRETNNFIRAQDNGLVYRPTVYY